MRSLFLALLASVLAVAAASAAPQDRGEPINDWATVRARFLRCWEAPAVPDGSVVSFRFMLAPNGGLKGPPRVMAKILKGSPEEQARFEAAAYAVLDRCLPLDLTPGFRRLMGEALIMLRFISGPRVAAMNLASQMTLFSSEKSADR